MKTVQIILVIHLIIISFIGHSQNLKKISIDVSAGKSVALRELATKVFGVSRGELADDGVAVQTMVSYYPWRHIGFAGRVAYNDNKTRHQGIILIASGQYNVINPVVESVGNWSVLCGMIGPTLRIGSPKLGVEGRLLVGYATVNSPTFSTSGQVQGVNILVKTFSQNAKDIAYGAGATLYVGLTKNLAFTANADATFVDTVFKGVKNQITSANLPIIERNADIAQSVGVLNITGGLRFSF